MRNFLIRNKIKIPRFTETKCPHTEAYWLSRHLTQHVENKRYCASVTWNSVHKEQPNQNQEVGAGPGSGPQVLTDKCEELSAVNTPGSFSALTSSGPTCLMGWGM